MRICGEEVRPKLDCAELKRDIILSTVPGDKNKKGGSMKGKTSWSLVKIVVDIFNQSSLWSSLIMPGFKTSDHGLCKFRYHTVLDQTQQMATRLPEYT